MSHCQHTLRYQNLSTIRLVMYVGDSYFVADKEVLQRMRSTEIVEISAKLLSSLWLLKILSGETTNHVRE